MKSLWIKDKLDVAIKKDCPRELLLKIRTFTTPQSIINIKSIYKIGPKIVTNCITSLHTHSLLT